MKYIPRLILAIIPAAVLVASAGLPSQAAMRTARLNAYDGIWSVVIYTVSGNCDRVLRYSVRIADSRVYADQRSYRISGAVAPSGAIRVTVAEGGRSANGSGRLTRDSGRGQWRTSTGQCAGQWTAERRG